MLARAARVQAPDRWSPGPAAVECHREARGVRDFLLTDADRAFRSEVRDFLARELLPRASAIENEDDWGAVKLVVQAGFQ